MNAGDCFAKTFKTKKLTFWSRTRNVLWTKGENSGNFLEVKKLRVDCDRDTILATVVPHGPVCHTGKTDEDGNILINNGKELALSNLNSRYQLLLNREIEIIDNEKEFTVRLPLEKPNE